MQICVNRITCYLLKRGIITDTDTEMFRYGLEKRLSTLMVAIPFFILAVFLIGILPSGAFFFGFFFLRSKTNGIHARTPAICLLSSLAMEIVFVLCIFPFLSSFIKGIISLLCLFLVFRYAPYVHPNLPLSEEEIALVRKQARMRVIVLIFISWIAGFLGWHDFSNGVTLGMAMAVLVLCLPYILKTKRRNL